MTCEEKDKLIQGWIREFDKEYMDRLRTSTDSSLSFGKPKILYGDVGVDLEGYLRIKLDELIESFKYDE